MKDHLPADETRLIDNHVLIDPVEAIIPGRGPKHKQLRREVRRVAFAALTEELISKPNLKVIMTGCLANNDEDADILAEHLRIAKDSYVPFYLIDVICKREEHGRRLQTRTIGKKTKLRGGRILEQLLDEHRLVDIKSLPDGLLTVVDVECMTLDTTGLTVEQTVAEKMENKPK